MAASQTCDVHLAMMTEESSTKDNTSEWSEYEPTGLAWDASANALVVIDRSEAANTLEDLYEVGAEVDIVLSTTTGSKNRVAQTRMLRGKAVISDLSVKSDNRQVSTYTVKFEGTGDLSFVTKTLADFINDISGMTYQGVGNLYYFSTGQYYAVGVAVHDYAGTYLFPLSHSGKPTKVTGYTDHVYTMTDYDSETMDSSLYSGLRDVAEASGKHIYADMSNGLYVYSDLDDTDIIGTPYIENVLS